MNNEVEAQKRRTLNQTNPLVTLTHKQAVLWGLYARSWVGHKDTERKFNTFLTRVKDGNYYKNNH